MKKQSKQDVKLYQGKRKDQVKTSEQLFMIAAIGLTVIFIGTYLWSQYLKLYSSLSYTYSVKKTIK